jgi:serine protease AprX
VRSLYGNRTLTFNADPYFNITGVQRVPADNDLRNDNAGLPYSGRSVTVAVLDTGINATHPDLAGRVVQNVKLADLQSLAPGFVYPAAAEGHSNTDLVSGHGTLVGGIIGGGGSASGGKFAGVAPGAKLLGLSAGDANLVFVLSGFDYLLSKGGNYGVRVVNCSFSAASVYDPNDPVNVATKMLTDRGVNVVFSAGNSGSGNGTMNPYAVAPWVIAVGATDEKGRLANYSSRGSFGDELQHPTLVAPGTNIAGPRGLIGTTGITGLGGADVQRLSLTELPYYTTATGTSFSAPQVAGAIALMLEANPNLTPAEVRDILARTATPLPKYFYHETGAGMLNTHAAVLEAAFPERHLGMFRSLLPRNRIQFSTRVSQMFDQTVFPNSAAITNITIPANTIQATISVAWGLSVNDLGLRVYNSSNGLLGEANYLNLPGLTGTREKVLLRNPAGQTVRSEVRHTAGTGLAQPYAGTVEITQVEFPSLLDLEAVAPNLVTEAERSMLSNLVIPEGRKFKPFMPVTRGEFAEAIVRAGLVPQYMAASPMYTDAREIAIRNAVESVQSNPGGALIADASGGKYSPYNSLNKLIAAIALVRAAGLESKAPGATLPLTLTDAYSIPSAWRGHVAVALQNGLIGLDGNAFNSGRALTRIELAAALNRLVDR